MKVLALAVAAPIVLALTPTAAGPLDTHIAAMQGAAHFSVTYTVTEVGGNQEEQTLTLGKPGYVKWESPTTLTMIDGKLKTVYTKATKTYTQVPISSVWAKEIFADDTVWAYGAFFDANLAKQVTSSKAGNPRNVRGVQLLETTFNREKGPITVLFDKKTGLARGGNFKNAKGVDVIIQVSAIEAKTGEFDAATFTFVPPTGATLAAAPDPNKALVFADIRPILARHCGNCHISDSKGRVSLNTAGATMSSGVVGETSEQSKLIRVMRNGQMPPRGPQVPKADIDRIAKWIDDGANE